MKKLVKLSLLLLFLLNFICTKAQVVSLPYFNDFETDTSGWKYIANLNNGTFWEWGAPSFLPDSGAYSGLKSFNATTLGSADSILECFLYSPIYDCSGFKNIDIAFNYKCSLTNAQEFVFMEFSVDGGVTWADVDDQTSAKSSWGSFNSTLGHVAWTGISSDWLKAKRSILEVNNSNTVQFRFSLNLFVFSSFSAAKFSVDDLSINGTPAIHLNLIKNSSLDTKLGIANTESTDFDNLYLYNWGTDTIYNFHLGYTVNGILIKDTFINEVILPGDIRNEFLDYNYLIPENSFDFCVYAYIAGDSLPNDTICSKGYGLYPTVQIPHIADFDTNSVGWNNFNDGDLNTNWELGTPTYGLTNSSFSGLNAWDINLDTSYTLNALTYLYSPVFDCSNTARIDLSFMQNRNLSTQTEMRLEISLDKGRNWTIVRDLNGYAVNWHNYYWGWNSKSDQWTICEVKNFLVSNKSEVVFRFVFDNRYNAEVSFDGVTIDDFKIAPSILSNVAIARIQPIAIFGTAGTQSSFLYATIQNRGVLPVSGFTVGFLVNGVVSNLTTIPSNLNPNDTIRVNLGTFTIPANLFSVCFFVDLLNDTISSDDTLCANSFVYSIPSFTIPYNNDFESGNLGWNNVGANTDPSYWELGEPNFGLTNSAHSGINSWDVNLNTAYGIKANCMLYSPFFDCSILERIDVSFWYNYEVVSGWDGVRLEISKNDGVSWNVLTDVDGLENFNWHNSSSLSSTQLPAWTGSSSGWKNASLKGIDVNGVNRILFRFVFNSGQYAVADGFSLDDFSISSTPDTNAACIALFPADPIIAVEGVPLSGLELTVKNLGAKNLNSYTIGLCVDGVPLISIPQSSTISPGQSLSFVLPSINVPVFASKICGYVTVFGDTLNMNDTTCYDIHVVNFKGLNYIQDFDTGLVDWFTINKNIYSYGSTQWELGTPSYGATTGAYSGINAWDVNLNSPCLDNVFCDLYSPSFSVSNLSVNHFVSFMLNYKTEEGWDGLRLEYSTDMAVTWNVLGVMNDPQGTNWYTHGAVGTPSWSGNSNGWIHCNYILKPNQLGSNMRFRFVYTSDASIVSDGVSIDDFNFSAESAQDLSLENFIVTKDTFMVGKLFPVNFNIANHGTQNVSAVNIGYNHNGVIGSFNQSITMIPNLVYTLWSPSLVALPGKNVLKLYIDDSLEVNKWNDTITLVNYGFERAAIPYTESFESAGSNGWFARRNNEQILWEHGVPNFGTTNSAHSGNQVWDVVLDSTYSNKGSDTLYSPVFNTVGWSNLMLSFWINYNILYQQTSVKLQYRINNSNNWSSMDALIIQSGLDGFLSPNGYGWSGLSFGWQEVRANLDATFQNKADLRFRFVFSNQFHIPLDGFSIDDFSISGSTSLLTIYGEKLFDIFPNPANDFLTIRARIVDSNQLNCTLYSIDGKVVLDQKLLFSGESTLNISSLSSGMYLLQLQSKNGELSSYRFVKN